MELGIASNLWINILLIAQIAIDILLIIAFAFLYNRLKFLNPSKLDDLIEILKASENAAKQVKDVIIQDRRATTPPPPSKDTGANNKPPVSIKTRAKKDRRAYQHKSSVKKTDRDDTGGDKAQRIRQLARSGKGVEEIADLLNISQTEVELELER